MDNRQDKLFLRLSELLVAGWNDSLSHEEFLELETILRSHSEARDYYFALQSTYIGLASPEIFAGLEPVDTDTDALPGHQYDLLWKMLAAEERDAPSVHIETAAAQEAPRPKQMLAKHAKIPYQAPRSAIYSLLLATAAIVLLIVFLNVAPSKPAAVAYLAESLDAVWANPDSAIAVNDNIRPGKYILESGYAKVRMYSGTEVILEGPSAVVFEPADNQLLLEIGKVTSKVPPRAIGFTVRTPNAMVVDYGTEFSVAVDASASAEVYVHSGKVDLRSGSDPLRFSNLLRLEKDQAAKAHAQTDQIVSLPYEGTKFVRSIDAGSNFVWKGNDLDMAAILAGKNGFDGNRFVVNVDFNRVYGIDAEGPSASQAQYIAVDQLSFVDGTFVPDGSSGAVRIASDGLTYDQFPDSSGEFLDPALYALPAETARDPLSQVKYFSLKSEPVPTDAPPSICLHANTGLTIDLAAIRRAIPGVSINGFRTAFKAADDIEGQLGGDIIILIDGKARFSHLNYQRDDGPLDIAFEIDDSERFLTLVCTEGEGIALGNWPLFVEPTLVLELIQD